MTYRDAAFRELLILSLIPLVCLAAAGWAGMEVVWAIQDGAAEVAVWNGSGVLLFLGILSILGISILLKPPSRVSGRASVLSLIVVIAAFIGSSMLPNLVAGPFLRDLGYERCGARYGLRSYTALWCSSPRQTDGGPAALRGGLNQ